MNRLREDLGLYKAQNAQEGLLLEKYQYLAKAADAYRKATGNVLSRTELCTIELFRDKLFQKKLTQNYQEISDEYLQDARDLYATAFDAHFKSWQIYWPDYERTVLPHQDTNSKITVARNMKNKAQLWNEVDLIVQKLGSIKESRADNYSLAESWSYEFSIYEDLFDHLDSQLKYLTDNQDTVEKAARDLLNSKRGMTGITLTIIGILSSVIIALIGWIYFS